MEKEEQNHGDRTLVSSPLTGPEHERQVQLPGPSGWDVENELKLSYTTWVT